MTRMTEAELAQRWDVSRRTLQLYRATGRGPAFVLTGPKSVFYRLEDVLAYEDDNTHNRRPSWKATIKRAAGAFDTLAGQARTEKARQTLTALRDELRGLI